MTFIESIIGTECEDCKREKIFPPGIMERFPEGVVGCSKKPLEHGYFLPEKIISEPKAS